MDEDSEAVEPKADSLDRLQQVSSVCLDEPNLQGRKPFAVDGISLFTSRKGRILCWVAGQHQLQLPPCQDGARLTTAIGAASVV
jgi:hypothetical protein